MEFCANINDNITLVNQSNTLILNNTQIILKNNQQTYIFLKENINENYTHIYLHSTNETDLAVEYIKLIGTNIISENIFVNFEENKPQYNECLIDYIEVDKPEKTLFLNTPIEYLFDFTEKITHILTKNKEKIQMYFTKTVKELVICVVNDLTKEIKSLNTIDIVLDNRHVNDIKDAVYYTTIGQYFNDSKISNKSVYTYSFAYDSNSTQPSGAFNFGNLRQKYIEIEGDDIIGCTAHIYALQNNVLLVKNGYTSIRFY